VLRTAKKNYPTPAAQFTRPTKFLTGINPKEQIYLLFERQYDAPGQINVGREQLAKSSLVVKFSPVDALLKAVRAHSG
jgi:hypothetical protein